MRPLEWGVPAGFDIPIYAVDIDTWPDNPGEGSGWDRWPSLPAGLATAAQLANRGLRPRNALRPDALQVGPALLDGMPVAIDWSRLRRHRGSVDWDKIQDRWESIVGSHTGDRFDFTYPCVSVYMEAHAKPLTQPPAADEQAEDRREAAAWAHAVLDDPRTVILEVGTIGTFNVADPLCRTVMCEIAVRTADGDLLINTLVNPFWDPLPTRELTAVGLNPRAVKNAPTFRNLRRELQDLLLGRRVVSYDRSRVYSVLYCELEYDVTDVCFESGTLVMDHHDILDLLGRSTFECAQLAYSRYLGLEEVDGRISRLRTHPSQALSAAERSKAVLEALRHMATRAPDRYLDLCRQAEEAERSGHSRRRVETKGERRVRLAPAREAAIIRAGWRCENPSCPDSGYTHDVTDKGEPLLQVHHIDEHAQDGRDHPDTMIALCANCHERVTRGRSREQLNETFRAAAHVAHQEASSSTAG
ncbi:HNH endonuclease [Nonomuraea sp. NPDC049129]|uniref:HNH endonuclease n=1 Tax=Nonomuraea sp. NPDC049129 TaxID=3155272 RepID=UPI0033F57887